VKVQKEPRPSKKPKKRLRRVWEPPKVAELGVSSLGEPAEVLVLKDRDRHVPTMAKNEAGRAKASQPLILEALQAENLPPTSESIKQSLEQISAPYRFQSKALSSSRLAELRKKIMDGFTQDQLRSYCIDDNRHNLVRAATMQLEDTQIQPQIINSPSPAEATTKGPTTVKKIFELGRAGLVNYILNDKWSLPGLQNEHTERHISVESQKLEYILTHKQSTLEQCAQQSKVTINASRTDGSIHIRGELEHVSAARSKMNDFCKRIVISRVRTVSTGKDLENIASSDFLRHLTETYNVAIGWSSEEDENTQKRVDRLTICYHDTQDLQNGLNAERAILLAERKFLLSQKRDRSERKISMWLSNNGTKADLVLHQAPGELNRTHQHKVWARWVAPQPPIRMGTVDPGPESPLGKLNIYRKSINRQIQTLAKVLGGEHDKFFPEMFLKQRPKIKTRTSKFAITDEIVTHFGKVLFSKMDVTMEDGFDTIRTDKTSKLLKAKESVPTLLSSDLPRVANFLSLLPPFDRTEWAVNNAHEKEHKRHYRLRYVPLSSRLPSNSGAPLIEIDILRKGRPGLAVTNYVTSAWAILEEQSHRLLTPTFAIDLDFVRRLKSQLFRTVPGQKTPAPKATWLEEFGEQIRNSDSDQFPPFLNVILPNHTMKRNPPKALHEESTKDAADAVQEEPALSKIYRSYRKKRLPKTTKVDYVLESSELVHSRSYRSKTWCLEHLGFESTASGNTQESLRLARQPLLDPDTQQPPIRALLERAFKIAAEMSDPQGLGPSGKVRLAGKNDEK
jgi:Mitochondrial inner-membrane-bound regulator